MSLEQQIDRLNDNLEALIAALGKNTAPAAPTVAPSSHVAPVKAQPVAVPVSQPAAKGEDANPASHTPTPSAVTKEQVKQAVLALIKLQSNEAAVKLLKKHGSPAGNLTTLPEASYAAALAECQREIA